MRVEWWADRINILIDSFGGEGFQYSSRQSEQSDFGLPSNLGYTSSMKCGSCPINKVDFSESCKTTLVPKTLFAILFHQWASSMSYISIWHVSYAQTSHLKGLRRYFLCGACNIVLTRFTLCHSAVVLTLSFVSVWIHGECPRISRDPRLSVSFDYHCKASLIR